MHRRSLFATLLALGASLTVASSLASAQPAKLDPQNTLAIDLKDGRVLIQLLPAVAPKHVERIKTLAKRGFYDNVVFHRVIDGFMAQTGDPKGNGTGGSDLPNLPAEFNKENFGRGAVGMARTSDPNSANSQFFIMFASAPHLNGQYTVWGKVVQGMEFVDKIKKGSQAANGAVSNPDRMLKVRLLADVK